jgi:D-xylose transport system substrate-binding protein
MESGRIRILEKTWAEGWTRENAYRFTSEQIRKNGRDIRAILCGNDSLAWGAIDALAEAQMIEQVAVSGQDADLVACQRIANGEQTMTTYKPIQKLVEKTVESCLRLAAGQKVPGQGTMSDGTYEIPYVLIDVLPVTKENMKETVIRDGFHLYEDIYQAKE